MFINDKMEVFVAAMMAGISSDFARRIRDEKPGSLPDFRRRKEEKYCLNNTFRTLDVGESE